MAILTTLAITAGLLVAAAPAHAQDHEPVAFDHFDADAEGHSWIDSYLLSLISRYAYLDEVGAGSNATFKQRFEEVVTPLGLTNVDFEANDLTDTEVVTAETDDAIIVAFRGTEGVWDIAFDATISATNEGIHGGFAIAASSVIGFVRERVRHAVDAGKKVWLTGHSLGGALATVTGLYLETGTGDLLPAAPISVQGVYTYGAPRVYTVFPPQAALLHAALVPTHRWVNNFDPVPHLPLFQPVVGPAFHHVGRLNNIVVPADHGRCEAHLDDLLENPFGGDFDDHSTRRYATRIYATMPASLQTLPGVPLPPYPYAYERANACDWPADGVGPSIGATITSDDITEGDTVTVTFHADPDHLPTPEIPHLVGVYWGDGMHSMIAVPARIHPFTHTYKDDGRSGTAVDKYLIRVYDFNVQTSPVVVPLTVRNAEPVITGLTVPAVSREGERFEVSGTFTDRGVDDAHMIRYDWGDGTVDLLPPAGDGAFSTGHTYTDDDGGSGRTVTITLFDDDDGRTIRTSRILVGNVSPSISSVSATPDALDEGDVVTVTGAFVDPGADTHSVAIAWGDSTSSSVEVAAGARSFQASHRFQDDGRYLVDVILTDDEDASDRRTVEVLVQNVAPSVGVAPRTIAEGALVGSATYGDPSPLDTHLATITWGDGSPDAGPITATGGVVPLDHAYADDGSYEVEVCVQDDDGATTCDTSTVTVTNVAPDARIDGLGTGPAFFLPMVGIPLRGSFRDAGTLDTHIAGIDWGDGLTSSAQVTESPFGPPGATSGADGSVAASHVFASPGDYTVLLSVSDDDGGIGAASFVVEVVTPEGAATRVLEQLLDASQDPALRGDVRTALSEAIQDLDGTPYAASSGALDKLRDGDLVAAVLKIRHALEDLAVAQALDPSLDLGFVQLVLTQTAESVAADLLARATAAADPASKGQQRRLRDLERRQAEGRDQRAAGSWIGAVDAFHEVARRSTDMLA